MNPYWICGGLFLFYVLCAFWFYRICVENATENPDND